MRGSREIFEVSPSTLRHLVAVTLSTEEMCEVMQEPYELDVRPSAVLERLVSSASAEGSVGQRLAQVLEHHLGEACPKAESIGCLNFFLYQATKGHDVTGVAAVLWCAACREGLAWRYFEERADAALELLALQAISVPTSTVHRMSDPLEPIGVHVSLAEANDIPLARVRIARPPQSVSIAESTMSVDLREDELESLYEHVGVALATMKLEQLISRRQAVQQSGA